MTNPTPSLPLFYRRPLLLRSQDHGRYGLRPGENFGFAAGAAAIPAVVGEFAIASSHYPIVFASDEGAMPMVVTGIENGRNLYVDGNGQWSAGQYIPGYVRRYPFIGISAQANAPNMLGIDLDSDRLSTDAAKDGAEPFFDGEGAPTERAKAAITFCDAYAFEHERSRAFAQALVKHNLLAEKSAEVKYPDSGKAVVTGFRVVDEAVFRALPAEVLFELHGKGWTDLIVLHLASQRCWVSLMEKSAQARAAAAAA